MGYNPFAEMYDATANDFRNAEGLNRFVGAATAPFTGNFGPRLQAEGSEQQRGLPAPTQQGPSPAEKTLAATDKTLANSNYNAGGADDIRGWALRNNPNPRAFQAPSGGLQNIGSDPYGQMAQMLSGQSQQRVLGSAEDNMRQLQTLHQLGEMTPTGGVAILGDNGGNPNAALMQQMLAQAGGVSGQGRIQDRQRAMYLDMVRSLAGNNTQLDIENMRGANAFGLEGARNRNALALENMRGQNQLAGYGMQGRNQLANTMLGENLRGQNQTANTLLGYGLQGDNSLALERLKQADPNHAALANYYGSMGEYYKDKAAEGQEARAYGKTPLGMRTTALNTAAKALSQGVPQDVIDAYLKDVSRHILAGTIEQEKHAQGGLVGYADGGAVDPIEEAYRRAGVQRPQQFRDQAQQQAQRPAQVSAPQVAPAPQREETWAEKARRIATGGLDRRMNGYARGGPIDVSGRQVLGDGTGKSDSIPAVIDGERQAGLSTGEFVMPVETVQHFGLDRLNKMVAQSRKGLDTGRQQA